jgi:hypothetical protein
MSSELREALTVAGVGALVPKIIDAILVEYQRRYSPLVASIPKVKWNSDVYYFNQRTQLAQGGFVVDGGAVPVVNSTYVQNNFQIKHLQVVGAVTGYAQAVTQEVIGDLRQTEIEGAVRGLTWDLETALLWANSASTINGARPQFDGLDSQINIFSGANQNAQDKGGNTLTLAMLDELIDMVESNAAMAVFDDSWQMVMSNTAVSKISQLLQAQQRFMGQVEVAAGLIVPTYRDIPLVKSSFLSTKNVTFGTVTATPAATGGTLPASSTYKYVVTAVMARSGETIPCAEVSATTSAGSTNAVALAFATPSGFEGASPTLYKVYRTIAGGATGTETLLGYVDATVGLAADGVTPILTTTITDTGTALVPSNGATVPAVPPTVYVGTNAGYFPPAQGLESIYLHSRDKNNLVRPYVREFMPIDIYPTTNAPDQLPFALVDDTTLAIRAPKWAGRLNRVAVAV